MTRRSNSSKFKVFDFEDDSSENMHKRFSGQLRNLPYAKMKMKNRKPDDSPINKYRFLQSFARGTKIVEQGLKYDPNEPIDVDAEGCQCTCPVMYPKRMQLEDGAVEMEISSLDAYLKSNSSTHENERISMVPSETSNTETCPPTTSTFYLEADDVLLHKQLIEPDCSECESDNKNMSVKIFPDIISYGDISFGKSCLTFSCGGIKLEALTLSGTMETFCFEWDITDIVSIESDWTASVETAMVKLHLMSKSSKGSQNANKTSVVKQLKFSVYDPGWAKGQEAIKRLDTRYEDIWNIHFDTDTVTDEKDFLAHGSMLSPKQYFCGYSIVIFLSLGGSMVHQILYDTLYKDLQLFSIPEPFTDCFFYEEPFEDVTYPKGDPDAVTIRKRDVELLEPEKFINDTIIDFYIKYLANSIQAEQKHRFHFFNCFFFRKLADLDKDPSSAYEGKAAFRRVCKWTRKVNLFEKDYIFIPVNYSLHWSLLVVCYPGQVPNFKGEEFETASKVPCILHMDSIRGSHKGLKNLIQSYLCEEWKVRRNSMTEDASSNFRHLKFVLLELPQQENSFDCGLFLLHYMERFLEEAPLNFSPFNITKFSNFLSSNWFPPEEASRKRSSIKKLIYEILQDHSQSAAADSIDRDSSAGPTGTSDQENGVTVLGKMSSLTKTHRGISSTSNAEQVGISLSKSLRTRGFRESGFVSSEFESGDFSRSYTDGNYLQLDSPSHSSTMSPIEEVEESDEQVAESPLDLEDCQLVTEVKTLKKYEISARLGKLVDRVSVCSRSSGSPTLSRVGIDPRQDIDGFDGSVEPERQDSSSTSCEELAGCVVPDSDEEDSEHDSSEIKYIPFIRIQNNLVISTRKEQATENINSKGNNLPTNNEDAVSESVEAKPMKRRRPKPP